VSRSQAHGMSGRPGLGETELSRPIRGRAGRRPRAIMLAMAQRSLPQKPLKRLKKLIRSCKDFRDRDLDLRWDSDGADKLKADILAFLETFFNDLEAVRGAIKQLEFTKRVDSFVCDRFGEPLEEVLEKRADAVTIEAAEQYLRDVLQTVECDEIQPEKGGHAPTGPRALLIGGDGPKRKRGPKERDHGRVVEIVGDRCSRLDKEVVEKVCQDLDDGGVPVPPIWRGKKRKDPVESWMDAFDTFWDNVRKSLQHSIKKYKEKRGSGL